MTEWYDEITPYLIHLLQTSKGSVADNNLDVLGVLDCDDFMRLATDEEWRGFLSNKVVARPRSDISGSDSGGEMKEVVSSRVLADG